MRPPMTSHSSHDRKMPAPTPAAEPPRQEAQSDVEASTTTRPPPAFGNRAKSMGHNRRESMQARRARRVAGRTSDVPEETDAELQEEEPEGDGAHSGSHSPNGGMKPVYLKGLFSVSTTSSRPLPVIRADIIRVLKQHQVEYREVKGGFSCKHTPSIVGGRSPPDDAPPMNVASPLSPASGNGHQHQRKISFGRLRGADRDTFRQDQSQNIPPAPNTPRAHSEDAGSSEEDAANLQQRPSMGGRAAGETSTHVQSDLGGNMALRFEVLLVKVPLLSLHGIQFKKVEGGTWAYKNMAQTILRELRL